MGKLILLAVFLAYCAPGFAQSERRLARLEFRMVSMIAANLELFCTNQSIPVPHDLTALFHREDGDEFLRGWERRFEEFGPDKGYTNMVLEKYAVIDPPVGGLGSDGDVVVVGVRPFFDEDQTLHRAVIRRIARGFIGTTFPEDVFAGWLEKRGITIPSPPFDQAASEKASTDYR